MNNSSYVSSLETHIQELEEELALSQGKLDAYHKQPAEYVITQYNISQSPSTDVLRVELTLIGHFDRCHDFQAQQNLQDLRGCPVRLIKAQLQ